MRGLSLKELEDKLCGYKYGKLTVIKYVGIKKHNRMWLCNCECGRQIELTTYNITNQITKSCGCLRAELLVSRKYKHGRTKTRIHRIWSAMKNRCYNSKDMNYKNYGARGICVCDEWKNNYLGFENWSLKNGYNSNMTIDRINVNGNYEPSNCRWISKSEQNDNTTRSRYYTFEGKTMTAKQWCDLYNSKLDHHTVQIRLKRGWGLQRALFEPINYT